MRASKVRWSAGAWLAVLVAAVIAPYRAASAAEPAGATKPARLLVVTVTAGFRHSSIETGEVILEKLGRESGQFHVDFLRLPPGRRGCYHTADARRWCPGGGSGSPHCTAGCLWQDAVVLRRPRLHRGAGHGPILPFRLKRETTTHDP